MARDLLIILRTCTTVNMLSGNNRYINVPKHELVNVCVSSLINSINQVQDHTLRLIVLDDHSSPEGVADIKRIIARSKVPTEFVSVEDGTGNSHTMKRVYELVEQQATDLWYHVEDDYLHKPEAIQDMIDSVDQFESNTGALVAVNPHDDIWRYKHEIYESILLLGPYRHYRTVKHTTFTCLASKQIYTQYRNHFQDVVKLTAQRADWVENKSINLVWNKPDVMLFSPIPGLAFHIMDESGMDPYEDIVALWDSVPHLWKDSTTPKVAIVSIFNEKHQALADETWTNKQAYAAKYGYQAIAKTTDFSPEQVHFDKFIHILDVMDANPSTEWVWWLDNDAMITNFDIRAEDLIDNDYHVIMGVDIASINTGSFFVRNSMQGRQWLEFLLSKKGEYKNDKKWFEQQAVIDFYPKFQDLFKVVPQRTFNSYDYRIYQVDGTDLLGYDGQWNKGDFVIHWPGLQNEIRVQLAQQYKKEIQDTK
jgi:galactosyl transferase GMA12/MNN10 family